MGDCATGESPKRQKKGALRQADSQAFDSPVRCLLQRLGTILGLKFLLEGEEANEKTRGVRRPAGSVTVKIKNLTVRVARLMFFEVMRDGEISESERKIMLWCTLVFANIYKEIPDQRIPVPNFKDRSGMAEAISYYMRTPQGGQAVKDFMSAVQRSEDGEGIQDNVYEIPTRNLSEGHSWADGFVDEEATDALGQAVAGAFQKAAGRAAQMLGTEQLLQRATPNELLSVCEYSDDIDLCSRLGFLPGLLLMLVNPLIPGSYMLKARMAEFYELRCVKGSLGQKYVSSALFFFLACLAYSYIKKGLTFINVLLYIRLFICSIQSIPWVLMPLSILTWLFPAISDWVPENDSIGCPEEGRSSLVTWLPDSVALFAAELFGLHDEESVHIGDAVASDVLLRRCKWRRFCTCTGFCASLYFFRDTFRLKYAISASVVLAFACGGAAEVADQLALGAFGVLWESLSSLRHSLRIIFNLLWGLAFAALVSELLNKADEIFQPKLILISLRLGGEIRRDLHQACA